jgi:hypothetical protein
MTANVARFRLPVFPSTEEFSKCASTTLHVLR